jgi:hypothetical protein
MDAVKAERTLAFQGGNRAWKKLICRIVPKRQILASKDWGSAARRSGACQTLEEARGSATFPKDIFKGLSPRSS